MSSPILIVRSVSFQQLDKNLPAIQGYFPAREFHILTHTHGIELCRKYSGINRIVDYDSRKNFTIFHLPPSVRETKFEAVVVPVANISAAGFFNVLALSWRIPARARYICNLNSMIKRISFGRMAWLSFRAALFSFSSFILAGAFCLAALLFILFARLLKRN